MHFFNIATLLIVLLLTGVEFSVSAFVNPSAWRLDPAPQARMLGHFASVLGNVMPFWYPVCLLLVGLETWFHRHTPVFGVLLAATAIWVLAALGSILFLVPLNARVAAGSEGWQQIHRTWDRRHRVRIALLIAAAVLLEFALVR